MKETNHAIRKVLLVGVGVFAVAVLVNIGYGNMGDVTLYPINQTANVSSFQDSYSPDVVDAAIPGCVGNVQNAVNGNGCAVTDCDGGVHIGANSLTASDIFSCVDEEYWDGFGGDYTAEENGCLANRCLNHGVGDMFSVRPGVVAEVSDKQDGLESKKEKPGVDGIEKHVPDCIETVDNDGEGACQVTDCDNNSINGNGYLTMSQYDGCLGDTPIPDASPAQLGCLADECLHFTGVDQSPKPTELQESVLTNVFVGADTPVVQVIEERLKEKGYFQSVPDTKYTNETVQALQRFQAAEGFPAEGVLTQETVLRLLN